MLELTGLTKAELCNLAAMDSSIKVSMNMRKAEIIATMLQATGLDSEGESETTTEDYVYPTVTTAATPVGGYALHLEDMEVGIGLCGVATEAMGSSMVKTMEEFYPTLDTTDDKVRFVKTKDGKIKGAAPRLLCASILGFTTEDLGKVKTWATRTNLMIFGTTTGAAGRQADLEQQAEGVANLTVRNAEGIACPVLRPTGKRLPFAVPVTRAMKAIAVYYRDSREKHEAIKDLKGYGATQLGVAPSGKGHAVTAYVTPEQIAKVLVRLGVGLPSQASDSYDGLADTAKPLVLIPARDPAAAAVLEADGWDDDRINAGVAALSLSKFRLAAARASGRKVRDMDESARIAQDGRHHEWSLRDAGEGDLADTIAATARAAR
tara:strand:- start:158 stop:1291 length:1134 start_codon:yes stop_codon:yes gene_type:complete